MFERVQVERASTNRRLASCSVTMASLREEMLTDLALWLEKEVHSRYVEEFFHLGIVCLQ